VVQIGGVERWRGGRDRRGVPVRRRPAGAEVLRHPHTLAAYVGEVEDQTASPRPDAKSWRVAFVVSLGICLLGSIDAGAGPARCHQVRPGDTLAAIAPRYRTSVEELLRLNRTGRKAIMRVGSVLMLPPTLTNRPLFATPGRLGRESATAQGDGLSRMRNDRMTSRFRRSGLLVAIPAVTRTYYVAGVRTHLRVARPWVRIFVEHLAAAFHRSFAHRLRITSLTRTRITQLALQQTNPSAAPADGAVQSTHLAGAAVDVSKRDLSDVETAWLRTVLHRLSRRGLVHAVEEFGEPHFHVMVRRGYADYTRRHGSPVLLSGC